MIKKFLLFFCLFSVPFALVTADEDVSNTSEEQCFQMLKYDMTEAGTFYAPLQELEAMTYQDLESGFSRFYKNLSSFGNFEINQGDIEMRIYSFGAQTGYIHPPLSPYPVSTKSEMWDEPAKENILIEEYIVDSGGNRLFMDCGFISIHAEDLTEVTRENYFYDNINVLLKKTAPDGSYKSWYSEILSFDRDDAPLVIWKRLFVYPKSTQNEYFNKYDVADANLGHSVESLDVLSFFLQPLVYAQDIDENGLVTEKVFLEGEDEESVEVTIPEVLLPVKREGENEIFSKHSYYRAIEARFPEFAKLLSFRGSMKYATVKSILSEEQEPEVLDVFYALYDYKGMRSYAADKAENERNGMIVEDPIKDKLLVDIANADEAIEEINGKNAVLPVEEPVSVPPQTDSVAKIYIYVALLLLLWGISFALFVIWKKRRALDNVQ